MRKRFRTGLITQATAIAFVHNICWRRAIRIWLTMMFTYIGGTESASTVITGTACTKSGPYRVVIRGWETRATPTQTGKLSATTTYNGPRATSHSASSPLAGAAASPGSHADDRITRT